MRIDPSSLGKNRFIDYDCGGSADGCFGCTPGKERRGKLEEHGIIYYHDPGSLVMDGMVL